MDNMSNIDLSKTKAGGDFSAPALVLIVYLSILSAFLSGK